MNVKFILFLQILFTFGFLVNCESIPLKYDGNIIHTEKDLSFHYYDLPTTTKCLSFSIRAPKEFHFTLSKLKSYSDYAIEFYLGLFDNTISFIKKLSPDLQPYFATPIRTPYINNNKYFHSFWLTRNKDEFKFGTKGDSMPLMQWKEYGPTYVVNYFGIRSNDTEAEFIFDEPNCYYNN